MALTCQQWGILPRSGGWHDQDANELYLLSVALAGYRIGKLHKEQTDQLTPDDYAFLDWIFDDGSTALYFS